MDSEIFVLWIEGCSFRGKREKRKKEKKKKRAILAKQGWWLVFEHSLVVRVLKARYFKHSSVLTAKHGHNWWSLLWGHGVLERGIWWNIECGSRNSQVDVYHGNWIPLLKYFRAVSSASFWYKSVSLCRWMVIVGMILCCGVFCADGCWIHVLNSFA